MLFGNNEHLFQARTNLIKKVSEGEFAIEEPEALSQHSEVMRTVFVKKEELELDALVCQF